MPKSTKKYLVYRFTAASSSVLNILRGAKSDSREANGYLFNALAESKLLRQKYRFNSYRELNVNFNCQVEKILILADMSLYPLFQVIGILGLFTDETHINLIHKVCASFVQTLEKR